MENKLLTVEEMAAILGVPKSWLYGRTRRGPGAIPYIRLGKYVRFDSDEVKKHFKAGPADAPQRQMRCLLF